MLQGLNEHDVNNVTMCQNDELIALLPQNESEVDSLYNIMTHHMNQQDVMDRFQHSQFDRLWEIMWDYTANDLHMPACYSNTKKTLESFFILCGKLAK